MVAIILSPWSTNFFNMAMLGCKVFSNYGNPIIVFLFTTLKILQKIGYSLLVFLVKYEFIIGITKSCKHQAFTLIQNVWGCQSSFNDKALFLAHTSFPSTPKIRWFQGGQPKSRQSSSLLGCSVQLMHTLDLGSVVVRERFDLKDHEQFQVTHNSPKHKQAKSCTMSRTVLLLPSNQTNTYTSLSLNSLGYTREVDQSMHNPK